MLRALYIILLLALPFSDLQAIPSWTAGKIGQKVFVENKGQVMNQFNSPHREVRFIYADKNFNLQLKCNGFSYELFEVHTTLPHMPESGVGVMNDADFSSAAMQRQTVRTHRIDVKLTGSNPHAEISGLDAIGTLYHFYTVNTAEEGITGVASFAQVKYKDIYPGIDLVFYAPDEESGSSLKYEWIIHPGADASRIKLQYEGAASLLPAPDEGYRLFTSLGTISESKVIAYREKDRVAVNAAYNFQRNTVSYKIQNDPLNTIVIDPNILWSSYYGGELSEDINNGELAVDKQAKVVIAGSTFSTLYIATSGAFQTSFAGGYHDAIVAKFTTAGKLAWATYYGSAGKDEGHAITTDKDNNVYLSGLTTSQTVISTSGAHQTQLGGYSDAFVVKFNAAGMRIWGTYLGGSIQDEILDVDCDKQGNIYFAGYTVSPDQIATPGAHQDTMNNPGGNNGDAFLGAFSPGGTLKWCSYFSGPAQDRAHGICVGKNGSIYIEGTAESATEFASGSVHQDVYGGGGTDAFIAKWDTAGNFYWCSYLGGINEDHGRGVKTDSKGNPYIIGWTASPEVMATPGAHQQDWSEAYENDGFPKYDGFLAKFNVDGGLEWSTYYGGGGKDQIFGLTIDDDNDFVYCGGLSTSAVNISSDGSYQEAYGGSTDGFIAKFTFDGARTWGSYLGAANSEELHGMQLDKNGFMYVMLSTNGSEFSVTPEPHQSENHGGEEAILIRLNVADACFDKYEPNNTNSTGYLIKAFDDADLWGYTAAISTSVDADWYKIKLSATTNFKVILTDLAVDYDIKLYKGNGQLLFTSANADTADEEIIYNNAPSGNYVLNIVHASNVFDPDNCYRLLPLISTDPWLDKQGAVWSEVPGTLKAGIFPNPASEEISIKLTAAHGQQVEIRLLNVLQQTVYYSSLEVDENSQTVKIPVQQLEGGMYLVELLYNGERKVLKVQVL